MKTNFVFFSLMFCFSGTILAQKNETKAAQGQFNSKSFEAALVTLMESEYLITNAKPEEKSEFYFLKGKVHTALADKNNDSANNYGLAIKAYNELILEEDANSNLKYTVQAKAAIGAISTNIEKNAIDDSNAQRYKESADKFMVLHQINPKDTLKLYVAATLYSSAKNNDLALKTYKELAKLNYTGRGMSYYAVNKATQNEVLFTSMASRDSYIKNGSHTAPKNVIETSKKPIIYNNLGEIYSQKLDFVNAEICFKKVIEFDPKNVNAYTNLVYLKNDQKKVLSDEMSNLGTSPKDMITYEEIKVKKVAIIKENVAYLEKANKMAPNNSDVVKLLLNAYRSLDMTAEYNALKNRSLVADTQ